jgi:hypothetical protein
LCASWRENRHDRCRYDEHSESHTKHVNTPSKTFAG